MKYNVTGTVTISIYTIVEAESKMKAIEIAEQREMKNLCFHCGGGDDSDEIWCTSGELDGTPQDISAEEEE